MNSRFPASAITLEGFRNRVEHVQKHALCAFMACESPQVEMFVRDSIGAVVDSVVADLMDIVEDMEKVLDDRDITTIAAQGHEYAD